MNYQKIYDQLIQKRQIDVLNKKDCYCERHHIIPRSLGGTNNKVNLVNLTAREHYIAHLLLWKLYKAFGNKNAFYKMASAITRLINGNSQTKLNISQYNSRLYEKARITAIQHLSQMPCPTKGKRFIHNNVTHENKMIDKNLPLPVGYNEGIFLSTDIRLRMSNSTKGKIYIRNDLTNELKQIPADSSIPIGWSKKRTKLNLTAAQKEIHRLNAIGNKGQSGKITIINDITGKRRFIFPTEEIPVGWHKRKIAHECIDCKKEIGRKAKRCQSCANKIIAKTRKPPAITIE